MSGNKELDILMPFLYVSAAEHAFSVPLKEDVPYRLLLLMLGGAVFGVVRSRAEERQVRKLRRLDTITTSP